MLEEAQSDVLLLLDCCAAASSVTGSGNGVTEVIAACGFETWAPGVGQHSFTRSLVEELRYLRRTAPFSTALLHNTVLSRVKYWKPRYGISAGDLEKRKTPIYIVLSNEKNQRSIEIAPIPVHDSDMDVGELSLRQSISRESSASSQPVEGDESPRPSQSSNSSVDEVWPDNRFRCPKVIISVALEEEQWLSTQQWEDWLRSIPALVKFANVEGIYGSDSTLLLISMPVAVWDLLPPEPALSFIGFSRTDELIKSSSATPQLKLQEAVRLLSGKIDSRTITTLTPEEVLDLRRLIDKISPWMDFLLKDPTFFKKLIYLRKCLQNADQNSPIPTYPTSTAGPGTSGVSLVDSLSTNDIATASSDNMDESGNFDSIDDTVNADVHTNHDVDFSKEVKTFPDPLLSTSIDDVTKKHKCPYCSTEFTRHHNLQSHLLTHTHEKPYKCEACNARFRRIHDLKRHTMLHTGDRPHFCPKCNRTFMRADALARHNKACHNKEPGPCVNPTSTDITKNLIEPAPKDSQDGNDSLDLRPDDIPQVINQGEDGWWEGQTSDSRRGWFLDPHDKILSDDPKESADRLPGENPVPLEHTSSRFNAKTKLKQIVKKTLLATEFIRNASSDYKAPQADSNAAGLGAAELLGHRYVSVDGEVPDEDHGGKGQLIHPNLSAVKTSGEQETLDRDISQVSEGNESMRERTKAACLSKFLPFNLSDFTDLLLLGCRKRCLDCDGSRPSCGQCIKSKILCKGYNSGFVFKDPSEVSQFKSLATSAYDGNTSAPDPLMDDATQALDVHIKNKKDSVANIPAPSIEPPEESSASDSIINIPVDPSGHQQPAKGNLQAPGNGSYSDTSGKKAGTSMALPAPLHLARLRPLPPPIHPPRARPLPHRSWSSGSSGIPTTAKHVQERSLPANLTGVGGFMEEAGGDLRDLRLAINGTAPRFLAKRDRDVSVPKALAKDDRATWKEFRRQLVAEGISDPVIDKHKGLIKVYVAELADSSM